MCAATTRRRAVSRCAPWPVVDSGPLGPAASSMSPTRFTVLGVKVSASPRRVHRWRTTACPRSLLGCLLSLPCPHSHNHAALLTVTTKPPSLSQSQPCFPAHNHNHTSTLLKKTPHPSPFCPHDSSHMPQPSALTPRHSRLTPHPSHPHTLTPSPLTPPHPHTHTPSHPHTLTPLPLTPRSSPIAPSQGCSGLTLAFAWLLLQMAV